MVVLAAEGEVTITSQTRGAQWKHRVVAANKAGENRPGNTGVEVL